MSRVANAVPPSDAPLLEGVAPSRGRASSDPLPRVLCVDDEPAVLSFLRRSLARDFDVVTEVDPAAALELVSHARFSVVISDMRMPSMGGTTFLTRVKSLSPNSTRLALTACLDWQLPPDVAFGILTKPCPVPLLQATVGAAAQFHALLMGMSAPPAVRISGELPVARDDGLSSSSPARERVALASGVAERSVVAMSAESAMADSVLRPRRTGGVPGASEPLRAAFAAAASGALAVSVLGTRVELGPRATLLGSAMECDIVTLDPRIAPRQLRFFSSWRGVTVQDVSGRDSARLNGERLSSVRFIHAGDRIDLGAFEIGVEAASAGPAQVLVP